MSRGEHPAHDAPAIDPARLDAPSVDHGVVGHERLLGLRPSRQAASVVAIVAPAGYGKTTALAEWAAHTPEPALWVSLDRHMNDPVILATHLARAILAVRPDPGLQAALDAPAAATVWYQLMPRISVALQRLSPFSLFIDDVHVITQPDGRDVLDWLMLHVPEGAQIVVAGRYSDSPSTPRLRVESRLVVLGPSELALTDSEARALLHGLGVTVSATDAAQLNRVCEGWVSGLVMRAEAATLGPGAHPPVPSSSDELVNDYIQAEILEGLEPKARDLLLRASVLQEMSGPMCDTVFERSGSQRLLERLAATNAFVARLPDGRYGLHELIRTVLLQRSEREDPEGVADLRSRAAAWHAAAGEPEAAIEYAIASGRRQEAARLIGEFAVYEFGLARQATLDGWLTWAETEGLVGDDAVLTAAGSLVRALSGQPERSERWAIRLEEQARHAGAFAGDREAAGCHALLEAWQCRRGAEAMLASAIRAVELIAERSPWRKSALTCLAFATLMNGATDEARGLFERVVEEGGPSSVDTAARYGSGLMLARQALTEHDTERAEHHLAAATRLRLQSGTTGQGLQALEDAISARVAIVQGRDPREVQASLAHAQPIRHLTSWAMPSPAMATRLDLVRAYLLLADLAAARVVLREAFDVLHWRPGLGTFEAEAVELRDLITTLAESSAGPTSLTSAELRLVPWLATHLSFRQIGDRLFLSSNTVKTEALSVYRKLGVSSRSAAVEAAVRAGLLDDAALPGVLAAAHAGAAVD